MGGIHLSRRRVLLGAGASIMVAPWLRPLQASDVTLAANAVQFRPEIEPLVRLLEETPRESLFAAVATKIRAGTTYTELLAATLLAGIRNVQPRPNVGFKFHCVMVIHAAHQATLAARDEHRWFPLFWSMDYFKRCQDQDRNEGDWTMQGLDSAKLPQESALRELQSALEQWDVEKGDYAAAAAATTASSAQLLDLFARYGARDFRNIGHKAIWVAGAFRTLEVIGWQHAEPVMRSLAFALLNHSGEPNPAQNDLAPDRAGRVNLELARNTPATASLQRESGDFAKQFVSSARKDSPIAVSEMTAKAMREHVSYQSIYDGMMLFAAELVMRQPAIVPLHAITSTNALRYLSRSVSEDGLRRWLVLQNASFLGHFRESAAGRGELANGDIFALQANEGAPGEVEAIFEQLGKEKNTASSLILQYARQGGDVSKLLRHARELVFLKGTDSHDYKYSSALFEDYGYCSVNWQASVLAAGSHLLSNSLQNDNGLKDRLAAAFS